MDDKKLISIAEPADAVKRSENDGQTDRMSFLKKVGGGIFASLLAPAVFSKGFDLSAQPSTVEMPELPPETADEDILVRMMRDVARAMAKPVDQRKWSMVIDQRKCVGCHSCTVSCVAENKLPPGVVYRPVLDEEIGTYPNVTARHTPRPCMQCEEPPCVGVCPVNATWKRTDGIVKIDYDQCIGCRYCITACPYSARTFDSGHYYAENASASGDAFSGTQAMQHMEEESAYEYADERQRVEDASPIGNARKCHFCLHRIEKGLLPQCTVSCIGRATFFGDANDPESMVAKLIGSPNVMRLKEEMGTKPQVHYLL